MRLKIILTLILFTFLTSNTTKPLSNGECLGVLCKVWGFMKYYHPGVNQGQINWDSVLLQQIPKFEKSHSVKALNTNINNLILLPGTPKDLDSDIEQLHYNSALTWIQKSKVINKENKALLSSFIANFNTDHLFYAFPNKIQIPVFDNEIPYEDMIYPSRAYRLLALFRAWNAVNYFFPYKKLMTNDMEYVLEQTIDDAWNAKDTLHYHMMLRNFAHYLEDSHANLSTSRFFLNLHSKTIGARLRYIDGKFVFFEVYDDYKKDIQLGDILVAINNVSIETVVDSLSNYYSGSNKIAMYRDMNYSLLSGNTDSINLTVERNNSLRNISLKRKSPNKIKYPQYKVFEVFNDKFFYFKSMPRSKKIYDSLMNIALKKEAIIFDLRYGFTIDWVNFQNYFYKEKRIFAKIIGQDFSAPGSFHLLAKQEKSRYDNSQQSYTGKIIVLTDEYTQSTNEHAVLFFRQAQNCVVIGTNTAGANGNTAKIPLPGRFRLKFSAVEVLTPEDNQTQKVGLEPDIYVERTIEGIREGKDEVLEYALDMLIGDN